VGPEPRKYGLLPFILGTLEVTAIAVVLAVPIGLGAALSLAFLVPVHTRSTLSTTVELLAAIPSVVYGLWGLVVLAPVFRNYVEPFLTSVLGWTGLFDGPNQGVGLLLAGTILFVMILPTMVAISRDVLAVVPNEQVEGAMALGATRWQVLRKVVVRAPGPACSAPSRWPPAGRSGRPWPSHWSSAIRPTSPTRSSRRRHHPVAHRQQLRGVDRNRARGPVRAGLVLLVIGIIVNSLARWLVWSTAGSGVGAAAR